MIPWLLLACAGDPDPVPPGIAPVADSATPPRTPPEPAAALASPAPALDLDPADDVVHVDLTAAPQVWDAAGQTIDGYAYNGQIPGPTIRLKLGDRLVVDLTNDTDLDTSLHWHGLSVPYAMDGAGWMIDPVSPGGTFRYEFTVEQAGTFWYHPHFDTERSVDLGLYGVVVVEDPADPPVDDDLVVVLDSAPEAAPDRSTHGIEPSPVRWLANGLVEPVWSPPSGTRTRVRILNASNVGYASLRGVDVIGGDQGLLGRLTDQVVVPPGDRVELLWSASAEPGTIETEPWSMVGPGPGPAQTLWHVEPTGAAPAPPGDWPTAPAPPTPDPGRTDLRYTFTGAPVEGWEINGQTFPAIEPDVRPVGEPFVLEIRNSSPVHHPYHLHGMTFEVLSIDGVTPEVRRIEDTLDVGIRQTVRLLVPGDNPGHWMSHCHILPHASRGMMTVLTVE